MPIRAAAFILLAVFGLWASEIPRPEYPQPQFEREQWMTLNGPWEFEFDDNDVGLTENWGAGARKFSRTILVPFCFESRRSGIGDPSFHPQVWYRRSFAVPPQWKGRTVLLHFGAVDYEARVWLNGQYLGSHTGGHTPFRFDVTRYLREGPNTLILRAWDPPTDRTIPRGKQYWEPKSRGIFYTRTTGIWQSVWLEAAGVSYLEKVRIRPGRDGLVRFDARVVRPKAGLQFRATISFQDRVVATASAPADKDRIALAAVVPDPRLWSPDNPNLYDVTFEVGEGSQADRVKSYFGFRSAAIENGRFTLNGRPLYLKMILDQGYWPESTITPPTDEAIQYDIRMTKEMGFHGARKHQKLEDPRYLYWADKMGLLVSSEMANAYEFDERYVERFTREWIEAVERDLNHPSVVMWIPINESWGTPDLSDPRQQHHLRSLYTLTHSLDGTRPVIDNDGWEHTEMTDLFGIHDYARSGDLLLKKYGGLRPGAPGLVIPPNARSVTAPGIAYNGSPVFLSEFGGIAYIPPGVQVPEEAWGYAGVEKTPEDALARLRGLYEAIANIPLFVGICYTQLTDVEQEVNGLLTYDRKPKFDSKVLREINGLLR
jgi:beta-galactosidase/beta-glucuronidase